MLLQIAVTKIHGISERSALMMKYLGNVGDGHMDLAVVQTQLTRHRGFLLSSAKGVGVGDQRRRATTYGHCGFLLPSAKGVGAYGHRGFLLLSTKGVGVHAGDQNVSTSNGAAAARKVLNAFFLFGDDWLRALNRSRGGSRHAVCEEGAGVRSLASHI